MGKTCTELFAGIDCTILGNADDEVNGIAYRSDRVQPGDAFFCVVGMTTDGHSFAQDAIDRGAKCSWSSARCTWPTLRTSRRSW